jgi:TonB family protein
VTGAGLFAVQEKTNSSLRDELAALEQSARAATIASSTNPAAFPASTPAPEPVSDAELVRLRDEAVALQRQLQTEARPAAPAPAKVRTAVGTSLSLKELDKMPRATNRKAPAYPAELQATNTDGSVVVSFVVDAAGKVQNVRAVESTHEAFEEAALAAVREWQFDPGTKGGRQVNTTMSQKLEFKTGKGAVVGDWF